MRQMSRQLELPLVGRGEAPSGKRSGEALTAADGGIRSGTTSTLRTAGCGPACPVVWQGSSRTILLPSMPIAPVAVGNHSRKNLERLTHLKI